MIDLNQSKSTLKNDYRKNGFVIIKKFINPKIINEIKKELLIKIKKKNKFFYYEKISNELKLRRIEKISDFSKRSKNLICSKNIINMIAYLENQKYSLFKDKLNFKYPGGKGYMPHIDGHFLWRDSKGTYQKGWKKYSNNFVNLVLPLEKADKTNGCVYLAKKSDTKKFAINFDQISNNLIPNNSYIKKKDLKKFKFYPIELNVGDICFFNWKCAHMSKNNNSKKSRMIFYSTYFKENNQKNVRKKYYFDKLYSKNNKAQKSLLV
tara:strand:+ start:196 stop:990 length:795 start_codon:yes stop_codon:yes gene_type:complete